MHGEEGREGEGEELDIGEGGDSKNVICGFF